MNRAVPVTELSRNAARWFAEARDGPMPVSNRGRVAGYLVGTEEYEAFRRFRENRRVFATRDLSAYEIDRIATQEMDARHAHLDALMDGRKARRAIRTSNLCR